MAQGDPKTATSVFDFSAVNIDGYEVKKRNFRIMEVISEKFKHSSIVCF
jgi:hypothetical protein